MCVCVCQFSQIRVHVLIAESVFGTCIPYLAEYNAVENDGICAILIDSSPTYQNGRLFICSFILELTLMCYYCYFSISFGISIFNIVIKDSVQHQITPFFYCVLPHGNYSIIMSILRFFKLINSAPDPNGQVLSSCPYFHWLLFKG